MLDTNNNVKEYKNYIHTHQNEAISVTKNYHSGVSFAAILGYDQNKK